MLEVVSRDFTRERLLDFDFTAVAVTNVRLRVEVGLHRLFNGFEERLGIDRLVQRQTAHARDEHFIAYSHRVKHVLRWPRTHLQQKRVHRNRRDENHAHIQRDETKPLAEHPRKSRDGLGECEPRGAIANFKRHCCAAEKHSEKGAHEIHRVERAR